MESIESIFRMTPTEQAMFEKQQNLFSIIKTIEFLEYVYMNGKVTGPQYDAEFRSLLHQFQMCAASIVDFNLDIFLKQNKFESCQAAIMRVKDGRSNYRGEDTPWNLAQRVFDITTKFIAVIDVLALGNSSVDEIAPYLRDVHKSLLEYPNLKPDYRGVEVMQKWVDLTSSRRATDNY